jgi:hypothetical protein
MVCELSLCHGSAAVVCTAAFLYEYLEKLVEAAGTGTDSLGENQIEQ